MYGPAVLYMPSILIRLFPQKSVVHVERAIVLNPRQVNWHKSVEVI